MREYFPSATETLLVVVDIFYKLGMRYYTANVFYSNSAFACNDNHIVQFQSFQPSDSIYLAFYALIQLHWVIILIWDRQSIGHIVQVEHLILIVNDTDM